MAIKLNEIDDGSILEVHLTGKLAKEDYDTFVPAVEQAVKRKGKIRMLVEMLDFHGATPGALWEDTKFGMQHFSDIERLAIIGEKKWQHALALFCKPFTAAVVRYFDRANVEEARKWTREKRVFNAPHRMPR